MYGPSMFKDEVFFSEIYTSDDEQTKIATFGSQGAPFKVTSEFFGVFAKVTRVFLWIKSIFDWKQKWLPLLSFQWYGLTSKIFWFKLHRPFFKYQVPDIDKWCGRNMSGKNLFFGSLLQVGANRNFWGIQNSVGFVVAIIKIWKISLVSLIWDPFQRTCRERPKSCTGFYSPPNFFPKKI